MPEEMIIHQSKGFFDFSTAPLDAILPLQTVPSHPQVNGLATGTGLLFPDVVFNQRVTHFPEQLYDLSPTSHLTRFLKALLGEAGVGQLRKRQGIARLQTEMESTHFFDLDRFYGAIFGAQRSFSERLAINPMADSATPDEWDDIHARDAAYRERIMALAKAIAMGATIPGLQAAAEAIMGTEVDIYETWTVLDAYGGRTANGRLWSDMETTFSTWSSIPETTTWDTLEGVVQIGRSGATTRSEIIVRPRKSYEPVNVAELTPEEYEEAVSDGLRRKAEDEYALIRVLSVLKPASLLLTVDNAGISLRKPVRIAALTADSEYWEVIPKVKPRVSLQMGVVNPYGANASVSEANPLPRPPFAGKGGMSWSHNPSIVSARAYAYTPLTDDLSEPGVGPVVDVNRQDLVEYPDGVLIAYSADMGVLDPRRAILSHYANDGVTVAHSYSGDRAVVPTWG